ncbi:transmembrane protein [Thraustotheca clavata]|uniref:Transmembrane protein n=1 Tax=Thraustotheca clavata TaxID=74557 RepID=A0A1W0A6N0_9STRA|nr:transmembrane protein [Thraustotheca clavata]
MAQDAEYEACGTPFKAPKRTFLITLKEDIDVGPSFIYPNELGKNETLYPSCEELALIQENLDKPKHLLSEWPATAIAGNDILSSVLYSAGLVALKAGKLAPIAMVLVSFVLYLFRFIYEEVVTAIPLNGGSYNCLLNTTSKRVASLAAVLSIMAYMATAVVSSTSACYYLQSVVPELPVVGTTVGVLGAFALLTLLGITESSIVALFIFSFHILTLTILGVACFIYICKHPETFQANVHTEFPEVDFVGNKVSGSWFTALFFGFSASMLGVTGYESASNYVEHQKPGIFRKIMRNMWAFSSVYNIFLACMGLGTLPMYGEGGLIDRKDTVLSDMGFIAAGSWLQWLVSIDAFIVLSGAVLTSYVGITGLVRRLSSDCVLPAFFAQENKLRGTNHWIILSFFLLTSSLVIISEGNNVVLSGVYTYSFLSMMFLFALGCMMLKIKRQDIPRDIRAPWWACILGAVMIAIGYFGILLGDPTVLMYFFYYALGVGFIVYSMLSRVTVLRCIIFIINLVCSPTGPSQFNNALSLEEAKLDNVRFFENENKKVAALVRTIKAIKTQPFIFFIKSAELTVLNKVILYVRNNEMTETLRFVHVYEVATEEVMANIKALEEMIGLFDRIYPKLRTDFVKIQGKFDAATVQWLSEEYNMPTNMMFIKQPTNMDVKQVSSSESPASLSAARQRVFQITVAESLATGPSFIFQNELGKHEKITPPGDELNDIKDKLNAPKHLLGEWPSTAICGNDIMSSVLYSAGIVATKAGKLAPVCMAMVSLVLYMYRFIYEEVVTAIPMNGGSYNCLLNTTTKRVAAFAAVLSILSYTATAVVSGTSACYYLQYSVPSVPVVGTTIALLAAFALLVLIGISESSIVALIIFTFHIITLTILAIASLIYVIKNPEQIKENFKAPYPSVDFVGGSVDGTVFTAIFFGFASSMLGVTGFESSANFVEQQQPGVFRKTLRNMWAFSTVYNIVLAVLSLGVLPIYGDTGLLVNANTVLANMADVVAGKWLSWIVSIDAFVVLSGAVLTSYVGINGLVRRLSSDRVMPSFLANENKLRGTNHWIILLFFLLTSSLVLALNGNNVILSGVYTYAFLSLMILFAMGCMTLKIKRQDIPRDVHAPWWACISGVVLIVIGYFGILLGDPTVLMYFAFYALGVALVVYTMLGRVTVLRIMIFLINLLPAREKKPHVVTEDIEILAMQEDIVVKEDNIRFFERENKRVSALVNTIKSIKTYPFVFFIKAPDLTVLNKVILYVRANEMTSTLRFVHFYEVEDEASLATVSALAEMVALFDRIYPKLKVDFVSVNAPFTPATITWLSSEYNMPVNMMFIKQPTNSTVHKVSGCGVRATSFEQVESPISESNKIIVERRNFHLHNVDAPATGPSFIFPTEVGVHQNIIPPQEALSSIRDRLNKPKHLLGEWSATAICGNDILSSVLYSAGLVALTAGKLAPISLALVSLVLYLYRFIYEEVVTAIPMNGGSYNCLLNTTSKRFASIAACLSILSYTATAVVSGTSASFYLQSQFPSLPVVGTTIGILGFFAVLVLFGIAESSVIALCIFTAHVVTLSVLGIMSLIYTINHPHIFKNNYSTPFPNVDFSGSMIQGNAFTAIFFGFSSAMLGVTGFESSSNFVEEQQRGVFRKTLRNMWALASVYNIFLSFMSLGVLPLNTPDGLIANQGVALAQMGLVAGGSWLQLWVAIDAFVVLSGAVLTAYVGINGLLRRLSTDRVVPQFFASENKWRKTNHWIIIVFFLLTSSLVWILNADNVILSGVYTYAFLSLMFLFGLGCMILKVKRTDIPRDIHAPWYQFPMWSCICGCLLIFIGFLGTLFGNPTVLMYFAFYFLGILLVVFLMLERVTVLRTCIFIVNLLCKRRSTPKFEADEVTINDAPRMEAGALPKRASARFFEREGNNVAYLVGAIRAIKNQPILFFIRTPNLTTMNKAILYVRNNEITDTLRFVHVYPDSSPESMAVVEALKEMVQLFDAIYPKLRTDLWTIQDTFDAGLVTWISEEYKIPTNMMFIKQPSASTTHKAASRGIRVITG